MNILDSLQFFSHVDVALEYPLRNNIGWNKYATDSRASLYFGLFALIFQCNRARDWGANREFCVSDS